MTNYVPQRERKLISDSDALVDIVAYILRFRRLRILASTRHWKECIIVQHFPLMFCYEFFD